jgi:hypothetical protein
MSVEGTRKSLSKIFEPMSTHLAGLSAAIGALLFTATAAPGLHATPSTTFWAPSTPFVQPFGVLHVTYDTYFGSKAAYPVDLGLTMGVLPWKGLQSEIGFDLLYPSVAGSDAIQLPIVLNAKVGAAEDQYFKGQPGWSVGIFGAGLKAGFNDQNVLGAVIGKTLPRIGALSLGGYYALNDDLVRSADGGEARSGLLAGWQSPTIDLPRIDRIVLAWDIQTGKNALGATGGGAYVYFTPAVDLLIGPVFFFDDESQPGGSKSLWTVQLDIDLGLSGGAK